MSFSVVVSQLFLLWICAGSLELVLDSQSLLEIPCYTEYALPEIGVGFQFAFIKTQYMHSITQFVCDASLLSRHVYYAVGLLDYFRFILFGTILALSFNLKKSFII